MSMQQLADTANVAKGTVLRIEHKGKPTTPQTAKKLARALEVDLEELASKEGQLVPLAPGSVIRAGLELAAILERDVERARRFGPDEMWEATLKKACRAFLYLQERRLKGDDIPAELEGRFVSIIEACLDEVPSEEDARAEELLRQIKEAEGSATAPRRAGARASR